MSKSINNNSHPNASRWGPRMILILMAMLTVSMAFFSGLYMQAGLPFFPSLIGGFTIFLTLYGTLPRKRAPRVSEDLKARFAIYENEIVTLTSQLEQFQGLTGKVGQADQLNPTLHQLEGFLQEMKTHEQVMINNSGGQPDAETTSKISEFSQKLQQLDGRIAQINEKVSTPDNVPQNQLQTQIESLDKIVREMAEQKTSPQPPIAATTEFAPQPGDVLPAQSEKAVDDIRKRIDHSQNQHHQNQRGQNNDQDEMLFVVTKAIEQRRVDIYLQPVVSLPQRKTVYYEVFTRLRNQANNLILPDMFVPVAEQAGLMPLIDNMMLLRAIKIIRQMDQRTSAKGLFCSLSSQSLLDPDFFPKLVAFLEKNRDLAGRINFEISQAQKKAAGPVERDGMRRLAMLGFHFSLDKVIDLDIDFDDLARMNFKFVRISADRLVNGMADLGARIHGEDKAHYLERFGLSLIVERIETERELATLADYSIKLGQGYLFAEPRPIRPEILGEHAA